MGEFSTNYISQLFLAIKFARNAAIYCLAIFIAIMLLQIGGSDLKLPTQRWRNIFIFASLHLSPVKKLGFGPGCPMESVQKVRKLLIRQLWTSLGRHRDRSLTSGGKKISFLARQKVFMIRRSKHIDSISVIQDQRQIFCQLSSRNINPVIQRLEVVDCPTQLIYSMTKL